MVPAPAAGAVASSAAASADVPPTRAQAEVEQRAPVKAAAENPARVADSMLPAPAAASADGARPPLSVARTETRRREVVPPLNLGMGRMASPAPPASPDSRITTRPLLGLRQQMAPRGESWSWRVGDAAPRPVDAALLQWLARLDGAAGDGWQQAVVTDSALASGIVLELLREGRPHAWIRLDADAVRFGANANAARPLRASLPVAVAQDLRAVLEALAR